MTLGIAGSNSTRLRFFVGLNTGYVTDGLPDERLIDFYRRRASPSLHCAIVGNVVIPDGYGTNRNTPTISRDFVWKRVAATISERGSLAGVQLATTWRGYSGSTSFRSLNSDATIRAARDLVRELGRSGVAAALNSLDIASELAMEAGFRHLQVHAAHGYLFSLLVDQRIYEGAADVIASLDNWAARLCVAGVETSIRISLRTGDKRFDAEGWDILHEQIANLSFKFVDVSSGFYNIDKQLIYPGRPDTLAARRRETIVLAQRVPQRLFIYSGRALLQDEADLPPNVHIGLCRDLIANPDFLTDPRMRCMNSGKCHYFSRGADHITCAQWLK